MTDSKDKQSEEGKPTPHRFFDLISRKMGVLAFPFLVIVAIVINYFSSSEVYDPSCTETPTITIQIGDRFFEVPRDYEPHVYGIDGDMVDSAGTQPCQHFGDPPIEASMLVIKTTWLKTELGLRNPGFRAQLRILSRGGEKFVDTKISTLDPNNVDYTEFPREGDFHLVKRPNKDSVCCYIAAHGTIETPLGYPFTVTCSAGIDTPNGHPCGTAYRWSKNTSIRYRFYDGHHSQEKWREMDAACGRLSGIWSNLRTS